MPRNLRIAYFAHSIRSDWNNGNAHFLRGLMRALGSMGHTVTIFEPEREWSLENLLTEPKGEASLQQFQQIYPDLHIVTYQACEEQQVWHDRLCNYDVVILHEWNTPALATMLVDLREHCGYKLLFHDTHHRASSSPASINAFRLRRFDGVLAFGRVLEDIYRYRYDIDAVWTLHEAADTTVFKPSADITPEQQLVWIGNWGEGERNAEIRAYLLQPAKQLTDMTQTTIYGVRYPEEGLRELCNANVTYGGYLPNLEAPAVYAQAAATVHIPRQQYSKVMAGIPTIRVFEALACGIPLVSAPWLDSEGLFRDSDFIMAESAPAMRMSLQWLLRNRNAAEEQALRGLETVLARHTCLHRAEELTAICEELLH
ncbi:MAG: glycosyltransferase [Terriglobus sp.]